MNIDAYNLDSLRALVRKLEKENQNLKQKLNEANIPYSSENFFVESSEENAEYDLDQGGRIIERYITENMAKWYFSMFWGRDDVYAKRGSKGGYFPQCNNRWNDRLCPKQKKIKMACEACEHKEWTKLKEYDKNIFHISEHFIKVEFPFSLPKDNIIIANGDDNSEIMKALELLEENASVTAKQMAEQMDISTRKVSRIIKELKERGKIIRIGSDRKGYWKIIR